MKFTKEQIEYIEEFFERNGILLIDNDKTGAVNLDACRVRDGFLADCLIEGSNPDVVYPFEDQEVIKHSLLELASYMSK